MPVVARCPSPGCPGSYRVPDDRIGAPIRCPLCKKSFTPSTEQAAPTAVPPSTAPSSTGSSPSVSKSSATALDRVGRFVVLGKLGSGAFGTVFKARDPQLERDVALKVPNPGMLDTPKRVERFLREAKSAARLRHPNIVPVFDAGQDGEHYYIASAYIDGQPLSESIEERGIEFRRAAEIVRKLAEAVGYAHDEGIVHRDIKPANVMLDSREEPHLMDFGLAARADEAEKLTNDGAVLGTPAYMAPEQAAGQKGEASPLSDQYALGVVLYELLTGQAPFSGPPAAVIYKVINHDPPSPRSIRPYTPLDLETICAKAMSKKPEGRYVDCGELAEDLRRWLEGEPIAARRQRVPERIARWSRKNKAVSISLATTAVSLLLGSALALDSANRAKVHARLTEQALENADAARNAEIEARQRADNTAEQNEKLLLDSLGLKGEVKLSKEEAAKRTAERQAEIAALKKEISELKSASTLPPPQLADNSAYLKQIAGLKATINQLQSQSPAEKWGDTLTPREFRDAVQLNRPHLYQTVYQWIVNPPSPAVTIARVLAEQVPAANRGWEWHYLSGAKRGETYLEPERTDRTIRGPAHARVIGNGTAIFVLPSSGDRLDVIPLVPKSSFKASYRLRLKSGAPPSPTGLGVAADGSRITVLYGPLRAEPAAVYPLFGDAVAYGEAVAKPILSDKGVELVCSDDGGSVALSEKMGGGSVWWTSTITQKGILGAFAKHEGSFDLFALSGKGWYADHSHIVLTEPTRIIPLNEIRPSNYSPAVGRFSPRETWVAFAARDTPKLARAVVCKPIQAGGATALFYRGCAGNITAITFNANESRMATADDSGAVTIWDTRTQECLLTLKAPGKNTRQLVFSEDGLRLIALTDDLKVRVWTAPSAGNLAEP